MHQSMELDFLYKTVYKTFLLSLDIEGKKSKNNVFLAYTISRFFSVFWPNTEVRNRLPKKNFTPFCSPFNCASNHTLHIAEQRSALEMIIFEFCLFGWNQVSYRIHIGNIFLQIFPLLKLNHIPIDRAWLALQYGI